MKTIEMNTGAEVMTALPPESVATQPGSREAVPPGPAAQPAALDGTAPPLATQSATDAVALDKAVAERVAKAKQAIITLLAEGYELQLYLRVAFTFEYIWLKIGNQEQYVEKILAEHKAKHNGEWDPALTTLQHYEGPMLNWLVVLASEKNPNDPNLAKKFGIAFLREHPEYILWIGDTELRKLARNCKTMVGLDEKYGNGRVKPNNHQPTLPIPKIGCTSSARPTKAASKVQGQAKTMGVGAKRTQPSKQPHQPRRASPLIEGEPRTQMNDDLREMIHSIDKHLVAMKEAGVPVERDARIRLAKLCVRAIDINRYFGINETLSA